MNTVKVWAILILLVSSAASAQRFQEVSQSIKLSQPMALPQPATLPPPATLTRPAMTVHACKPGPWGDLEYHYLYLEAPMSTVELINVPSRNAVWWFPEKKAEQVLEFLVSSGAPPEEVQSRLSFSKLYQNEGPYKFFPSSKLINELEPAARETIYAELRKWPENKNHHSPVVIASGDVYEWFKSSGLRQETIRHIEKLSYPLGKARGFSDVSTVVQNLYDDQEERLLLKALTRTRSLILSLRIESDDDIEALKDYWSAGYKSKDVLTLFDAVARIDGLDTIDVTRLLPPTPRKYLYTFPSRSLGVDGTYPDSFWASLNFFNYFPDEQFDDIEKVMRYANLNYDISSGPMTFGDLIIMKDAKSGQAIHSCVFIADDIVYSKNSRSIFQPFILVTLDELFNQFSINGKPLLEVWTKKER